MTRHRWLVAAQWGSLAGLLLLAVWTRLWDLWSFGTGNQYYAAAVLSQLQDWRTLLFNGFDSGGYVTVDKPPLGLWVQGLFARTLGFSGAALVLPQALAGIAAVLVLYRLVARAWGHWPGLLAGAILVVSPISVATDRNNTMDSQLVLVCLLAVWAAWRSAETGRWVWALLAGALIGVGFEIKMLQVGMAVPAVMAALLVPALERRPALLSRVLAVRVGQLASAALLAIVIGGAWPLFVDLTPPGQRPWVGSSAANTVADLITGHNGGTRLGQLNVLVGGAAPAPKPQAAPRAPAVPAPGAQPSAPPPAGGQPGSSGPVPPGGQSGPGGPATAGGPGGAPATGPPGGQETGAAGPLRLFNEQLAPQAGWWLPLAVFGMGYGLWRGRGRWWRGRRNASIVIWAAWLVPMALFFSWAGLFHRYYLSMLVPGAAALSAAAVAIGWHHARAGRRQAALLALALLVTAAVQLALLAREPAAPTWLTPAIGIVVLFGASGFGTLALRGSARTSARSRRGVSAALALACAGLLLAPASWSVATTWRGTDAGLPAAEPFRPGPVARPGGPVGPAAAASFDRLLALLTATPGTRWIAAVPSAQAAAPLIIAAGGRPVMAIGGFSGRDPIQTPEQLAARVAAGELRYVFWSAAGGIPRPNAPAGTPAAPAPAPGAGQAGAPPGGAPPQAKPKAPPDAPLAKPGGAAQPAQPGQPPTGTPAQLPAGAQPAAARGDQAIGSWLQEACQLVPPDVWRTTATPSLASLQLYDCRPASS